MAKDHATAEDEVLVEVAGDVNNLLKVINLEIFDIEGGVLLCQDSMEQALAEKDP
ncbi:MAG TPA: hypothetical protein PKV75_07100 [Desulfobacterales bacterium]|nr:hypothetical protein [Desulfobacterales bacterium]